MLVHNEHQLINIHGMNIKKLAALSMLHKAKKAYYACDVIQFLVPYAARNRLAARTGCAVHTPCLLAVRQLP